jgi:hypothetical protein
MKLLLYSGVLYLITIGVVLTLRPTLMFTADGNWKEFGIGRDCERYTWMPFWLFSIVSAIICYIVVLLIASTESLPGVEVANDTITTITPKTMPSKGIITSIDEPDVVQTFKKTRTTAPPEMKPGYYILNVEGSGKKGVPKYIYLGPEAPNLIYNNVESE